MSDEIINCEQCGLPIEEEHYFTDPEGVNFHNTKKCLSWIEEDEGRETFKVESVSLINKYGLESTSDTPDFVLADYLINCLANFNVAYKQRKRWHE